MKINSVTPHTIRATSKRLSRAVKIAKLFNSLGRTKKISKSAKAQKQCLESRNKIDEECIENRDGDVEKKIRKDKGKQISGDKKKRQKIVGAQFVEEQKVQMQQELADDSSVIQNQIDEEQPEIESQNQSIPNNNENVDHNQELVPLDHRVAEGNDSQDKAWYFSDKKFTDFQLSEQTLKALEKNSYVNMTHIQARTLPLLMRGKDVLGAAKTGSGKTLAYLIPCFQKLRELQFKQVNGTGVIVITPTRELAIQVFDVAKKLGQFHNKTIGLLIGGMNRKMESLRLQKGVNLLICTPGRLLDHLQNSKFIYHNLFSLIIDQADALLRIGFEQQISDILKVLPKNRQTVLFSATQTRKIEDLAKLSLQNPIYIGVDDMNPTATVQNLEQGFVVINAANKFRLLLTFLRKQKEKKKKVMVFFSSCNSVKFYSDLLNYIDISVMDIHGKQKQQKRSTTFYEFGIMKEGILLCTDVAARGLDIPQVDWIIQYDPPLDIREYIHRVGRTCRGSSANGKALLLLLEEEKGYLKHLLQAKVELNEYEFEDSKLQEIQNEFELLIQKNRYLYGEATSAFKSYLHAYTTYSLKEVFNVHSLDLKAVATSFGLKRPPHVDLNLKLGGSKTRKLKEKARH